jgi:hypothetical protein
LQEEDSSSESDTSLDDSSSEDDESVYEDEDPVAPVRSKKRKRKATVVARGRKSLRQGGETWVQRQQELELLSKLDASAKVDESPACAAQRLLTLAERPVCLPCRDSEKQV